MPWLLMTWRRKSPGHQQPWYWPSKNTTFYCQQAVFPKSRQQVCFVRRRIQMSDVEFVKIISIWCLSVQFGRRSMKSIREDWAGEGLIQNQVSNNNTYIFRTGHIYITYEYIPSQICTLIHSICVYHIPVEITIFTLLRVWEDTTSEKFQTLSLWHFR